MEFSSSSRLDVNTRSRARFWMLRVGAWAVVAVVAVAGLLVGLRAARAGALPGARVAGVEVGGMEASELRGVLNGIAQERAQERVTASRGDKALTATNKRLGYRLDVDATVDAILERGRQLSPIDALTDHLRAFNGVTEVTPREIVRPGALDRWTDRVTRRLRRPVVEASVNFEGAQVVRIEAEAGERVIPSAVRVDTRRAVLAPGDDTFAVQTERIFPDSDPELMAAMERAAERAVSGPVHLIRGDGAVSFEPDELGAMLVIEETGGEGRGFRLTVDRERLVDQVSAEELASVETDPIDADITLADGAPQITPSQEGLRFNARKAARQVERLVKRGGGGEARTAGLNGNVAAADFTTEDAEELGITEMVSTFTTEHACCESRVANIQRFADIMEGALVRPGETLSLNGYVGERTVEKGFVGGGAISGGEYVEQIGGGVSQFATTFFNAVYFGGYEIVEHKPHSYYISRYPMGRESTINYPNVDVEVLNNSPYGFLVDTSYTDTSITVTLWGTEWVEVDSITGEPHNFTPPETIYQENDALPVGEEVVVQEGGGQGFDIVVTRILNYPDGRTEREEYFTRYYAEARIVERNTP